MSDTGILLVGHGSRSAAGRHELLAIGPLVERLAPAARVEVGFLEMSDPPAGRALDRLAERGATRIAVVPLMLLGAGHAKSDVPAVVLTGRLRHPGVEVGYGRPLGPDTRLLDLASKRIAEVGGTGLPLALLGRGTTEPHGNAEPYAVGRLLAEHGGHPLVLTGFSGMTWPSTYEVLDQLRRLGADRIAAVMWFLCTGVLVDRMRAEIERFRADHDIPVLDAGHLGVDEAVGQVVLERAHEALHGEVRMSCDTCTYRRPFPGFEGRVGQAVGVGHSHLAAEHQGLAPRSQDHPHPTER